MKQQPLSLKQAGCDRRLLESLRSGLGLGNARSATVSWANAYAAAGKGALGKAPNPNPTRLQ